MGQITLVTQPDGVALGYIYDDAHRLTDILDSPGNRIHYTLVNTSARTMIRWRPDRNFGARSRGSTTRDHP